MTEQLQDNFAVEDRVQKRNILKTVVIIVIIGAVSVGFVVALFFWPKNRIAIPVVQQDREDVANIPPATAPINGVQKPSNIPDIAPGINRPLTAAEKQKYGFSTSDDIWMRSSNPIDGSQPAVSFYNKTVNPNPYPTVPVIVPHD